MEKEWRKVKGFSKYEVSELGVVRNARTKKIIKPFKHMQTGYVLVKLYMDNSEDRKRKFKNVRLNRVVATAWKGNPENKPEANHVDGVKQHNHASRMVNR